MTSTLKQEAVTTQTDVYNYSILWYSVCMCENFKKVNICVCYPMLSTELFYKSEKHRNTFDVSALCIQTVGGLAPRNILW